MKNIDKFIFPIAILIGGVALLAVGGRSYNVYRGHDEALMICGAILIIIGLIWGIVMYSKEDKKWYEKAAEEGDVIALYYLGTCYYNKYSSSENNARAAYYWHKAAEQGYAPAQCKLGNCYENGEGVEKDKEEAIKWYKLAAKNGSTLATAALKKIETNE